VRRPVVAERTHAALGRRIMFAPRTSEELVAACSIQGRVPFNHKSRSLDSGGSPLSMDGRQRCVADRDRSWRRGDAVHGSGVAAWWTRATLAPFQVAAVPGEVPARLLAPRTADLALRRSVPGIGRAAVARSGQLPQRSAADPAMKGRQARALTWDGWCLTRSSRKPFRSAVTGWGRPPRLRRCAASNRSYVT
jgi:hypothetical protein